MDDDVVPRALARGEVDDAPVTDAERALLRYALKLTRAPWEMTEGDVDELRAHGFDDRAIHDLCHVASYYNYVNRMADGLGVELESAWTEETAVLTREEFESRPGAESRTGDEARPGGQE